MFFNCPLVDASRQGASTLQHASSKALLEKGALGRDGGSGAWFGMKSKGSDTDSAVQWSFTVGSAIV